MTRLSHGRLHTTCNNKKPKEWIAPHTLSDRGVSEACDAPRCTADTDTVRTCIRRITTRNQYKNTPVCVCTTRVCARRAGVWVARAHVCVHVHDCVSARPFSWKMRFFSHGKTVLGEWLMAHTKSERGSYGVYVWDKGAVGWRFADRWSAKWCRSML